MAETAGANGGFEGPEKILEIDFVQGQGRGLRQLPRETWDAILDLARCKILCSISNEHMDAYVLSESSLFVFDFKCFLKTCGTTTLLRCLPLLLNEVRGTLDMEIEWLGYSRKNFTFPGDQQFPHTSFTQEVSYTKNVYGPRGELLLGGAYVLGDLSADHWYVYVADYCERDLLGSTDINVNIMMHDLDPNVMKLFFMEEHMKEHAPGSPYHAATASLGVDELPDADTPTSSSGEGENNICKIAGRRATIASGIDTLIPGARIDDWMFEPCGYSMNAICFETYYTIHVTPEEDFSYASFETNLHTSDYESLLRNVLTVFRPKRFTVTMFADRGSFSHMVSVPNDISRIATGAVRPGQNRMAFKRINRSSTCLATDYICDMANYVAEDAIAGLRGMTQSPLGVIDTEQIDDSPFSGILPHGTKSLSNSPSSSAASTSPGSSDAPPPLQIPGSSSSKNAQYSVTSGTSSSGIPSPIPLRSKHIMIQKQRSTKLHSLHDYDATQIDMAARSV